MKRSARFSVVVFLVFVISLACNLPRPTPTPDPGLAFTAAAQTVMAQLTQVALTVSASTPTLPPTPSPTFTPLPTLPPTLPPTPTQICDQAKFIADIGLQDGAVVAPGQAFTWTWRIQNVGTCSWTPAYTVVFDSGAQMGGPTAQALTTNVNPGQTVDISVNLVAPTTPNTYRGYWKLRNPAGMTLIRFYADIRVQPASVSVTLTYLPAESGLVASDGVVNTLTVAAGDSMGNLGVEAFLSFDMSVIPAGAVIQSASLKLFGGGNVRGDPFAGLGCLRAYLHDYGTVDPTDFVPPGATGAFANWCSASDLSDPFSDNRLVTALQTRVGTSRFRFRLQFRDALTDGDGAIDDVLILAPVILNATYTLP